jgi:uncharacterized protein YecE (DUF72 family)
MAFQREQMKAAAAFLAARGIYVGTSSWKYAGWRGQLYDESRYVWKGRLSEARFERLCLAEYAQVFKSVCVDAAYYKFPTASSLGEMVSQVPADFQFALKVTDEITIKKFPNLPRFGPRAGEANEHFLNADLFASDFLGPCEEFRANIGLLMFEFSRFSHDDYEHGREFVAVLDEFLGRLPKGWRFGVEIRNKKFLHPDYFAMLARHGVAHVFNSWTAMSPVEEQIGMSGSLSAPDFVGARFLLRPGRGYEAAVKAFSPYQSVKDLYPEGRAAGAQLIHKASETGRKAFVYVNNRFEGNALETIAAMIEQAEQK